MISLATAISIVALIALNPSARDPSARADELSQNLGPVGPHEPILTTVGNKRVLAFFEPSSGHCALQVVVWNTADVNADTTARIRTESLSSTAAILAAAFFEVVFSG